MTHNNLLTVRTKQFLEKPLWVFALYWLVVFALYLPAAKAGMVGDLPYYIESYRHDSFWDFISMKDSSSLYHTAALNIYVLFKLFGINTWGWHMVYVTLHALDGLLIFLFFDRLLRHSGIKNATTLSFATALLFVVCPHASEVVVWKPCAHYLVSICTIFLILLFVQKYQQVQKLWYAVFVAFLFFYSSFSHEFFYLAPWLALAVICYYHFVLNISKAIFKRSLLFFFAPLLSLFLLHLALLHFFKHSYISHFGKLDHMSWISYLSKPLKYCFHVILFGRYFPADARSDAYALCESPITIFLFYASFLTLFTYVLVRFKKTETSLKLLTLAWGCTLMVYIFLSPVYFADTMQVCYDRYTYLSLGFAYLTVALLVNFIRSAPIRAIIFSVYALFNIYLTITVNISWKQSAYTINRLLNNFPDPGNKTVLLLNLPDDLNGVPMIAAEEDGRFKMMKNTLTDKPLKNEIYDVVAYKLSSINDGAHIMVINDSMLHVTLNQWGTWWIRGMLGARSYETSDYKVNMTDVGHWYELTLKHPADKFMLLYEVNSQWKVVDWNKKNIDQY